MQAAFNNPFLTILAEMSGTFFQGIATAQRDWADFVHRRINEDMAVGRQLMNCHSFAEMHQAYALFLQTAFKQYQEHSERLAQRGQAMAQHVAERAEENAKEVARARH
jgi:uncharacterized protein YgfB (UPF0149 family)